MAAGLPPKPSSTRCALFEATAAWRRAPFLSGKDLARDNRGVRTKLATASILSIAALVLTSTFLQVPALGRMEDQEPLGLAQDRAWESGTPAPSPEPTPDSLESPQPEGWTAGETSASELNADERAGLCGVPLEVLEWEELQASEQPLKLSARYTYPSSLDWRNFGGQDWTTPIRNQGSCGSCTAFGTTAAIESRLEIATDDPGLNPDLSEAHLFYCGCGNCCGTGWSPGAAMNFAGDTGIVHEACYPYTAGNQACSPCGGWQDRVTQISGWTGTMGTANMKQTLADHGPFEATMLVYSDFFNYSSGVYRQTWGQLEGAHAVTVVGYNEPGGYWIVKNSWGTGWGENGWFKIAYGECGIDDYVYVPTVPDASYHLDTATSPSAGGTVASDPPDCEVGGCEEGTDVEVAASPNAGYEFTGWSGDLLGSANPTIVTMDADKSVTAHFVFSCDECTRQVFLPLVVRQ